MDQHRHVHLKLSIRCLTCLGFWPAQFSSKALTKLYTAYFLTVLLIYVVFVATQFVEMLLVLGKSLEDFSELMGTFLLYGIGLMKAWVIGGKTVKRLARRIFVTELNILSGSDQEVKRIYSEHVQANYAINRIWISMCATCYVLYVLTPTFTEMMNPLEAYYDLIDNQTVVYRPRPLPLVSWFPFDRYKYYKSSFGWHLVCISITTPYNAACNTFFFGLSTFAVGQIKVLQENLRLLDKSTEDVAGKLRDCIVYHKAIIRFVQELSDAMRTFLLMDFAACALQMAVIGFQAAVMDVSFRLLRTITYLGAMLTQLFFFYWYGNEILLESMEVAKAIWEGHWYLSDEATKKTLLIAMMRAQKPLSISVGPFYIMSTETMLLILRAGYSYTALMRRFYAKK